jgi:hypothetical protein
MGEALQDATKTQRGKALPLHAGGGVALAGFGVGVRDAGVVQWCVAWGKCESGVAGALVEVDGVAAAAAAAAAAHPQRGCYWG